MLERFTGREGQSFVIDALRDQYVVGEAPNLAETIGDHAEIRPTPSAATVSDENLVWG